MKRWTRRIAVVAISLYSVLGIGVAAWLPSISAPTAAAAVPTVRIAAVGDIADADLDSQKTADQIAADGPDAVLELGDLAYPDGTTQQFNDFYDPTWGQFNSISFPAPGNHEYDSPDGQAEPYYDYFGSRAHGPDGYYAYTLGAWTMIALNSEIATSAGSAQYQFLEQTLEQTSTPCTLAYWHKPLFASTKNQGADQMGAFWGLLHEHDADLVLNGHAHHYERFAPQNANGSPDPSGPVEIISGLGGASVHKNITPVAPNSLVRSGRDFGSLFLDLADGSYSFAFETYLGSVEDSQSGVPCHNGGAPPPSSTTPPTSTSSTPPPSGDCPLARSVATSPALPVVGTVEACADPGNYRVKVTAKQQGEPKSTIFDQGGVPLTTTVSTVGSWMLADEGTYTVTTKINQGGSIVATSTLDVTVSGSGGPPPPSGDCPLVRSVATSPASPVQGTVEACADPGNYRVRVVAKQGSTKTTILDLGGVAVDGTVKDVGSWSLTAPGTYEVISKLNQGGANVASSIITVTVT
ncbi:MAG: metallophosphoesterase [Actinomycetota bacterium]